MIYKVYHFSEINFCMISILFTLNLIKELLTILLFISFTFHKTISICIYFKYDRSTNILFKLKMFKFIKVTKNVFVITNSFYKQGLHIQEEGNLGSLLLDMFYKISK